MNTRKWFAFLVIAAVAAAPLLVRAAGGEETTVKGEVLDLACYIANDGHGKEHAGCAEKCVKSGQPMGLLAKDGTVYVLFADHGDSAPYEKAKDFAGKNVEITGAMSDRAGVKGISVQSVKAL